MTSKPRKLFRVGSRKSELALIQTKQVIARLQKIFPDTQFEIHTMTTIGDRVLNISLPKIGEKSLFTRDLEDALRNGGVDFVVHSLKDLPTTLPPGMTIGAVLQREDARDALVLKKDLEGYTIESLPEGSVIGTSSLRRTAQIKRKYPHLKVCDIRGNLNTRLMKLDSSDSMFSGIILAQAGLLRMGWGSRISQVLDSDEILYAVGQGALAIECRADDCEILNMLQKLICISTLCRILAERSFLNKLGGGCSAPVAVISKLDNFDSDSNGNDKQTLTLEGAVWSLDGITEIRDKASCTFPMLTNVETDKRTLDLKDESLPPAKRIRLNNDLYESDLLHLKVINDDTDIMNISKSLNLETVLKKHINLAKKCPILGMEAKRLVDDNNKNSSELNEFESKTHCPLHIEIGQDFMGQCPFIKIDDNENCKASTSNQIIVTDKTSFIEHSVEKKNFENKNEKIESDAMKCPFLQKAVQIIEYDSNQKSTKNDIYFTDKFEDFFCGLYCHTFYNRELYHKAYKLGCCLAEKLIKEGALAIMNTAKAEIHSKT